VAAGLVASAFFLPLGLGMQQVSAWVLNHMPAVMKPEEQRAVQVLRSAASWGGRGMLGLITILLVPVAEEVFFRGILYTVTKQAGFHRLALWGTAGFFALIHFNLATFVPLMALALVLTILYERTENLLAPIAAHSLFNALNFGLVCFTSTP
jgi:membrane protease YdiL (CAAX protease family)